MKKIVLLLCALFFSFYWADAQKSYFYLQHDGSFITSEGKNYVVVYFPDRTKNELYNQVLINVSSIYVNPNSVISKIENEMISINGYSSEFPGVTIKGILSGFYTAGATYTLKIFFKDGKIRIDAPQIISVGEANVTFNHWLNYHKIYKDYQPNPKHQYTIDHCNRHVNNLIHCILSFETKKNNDW